MRLSARIAGSRLAQPAALVPLASVLAVAGPAVTVSAGMWDALSHLQREPELFWSVQHVAVYAGVSMTACAAAAGCAMALRGQAGRMLGGIRLLAAGAAVQMAAGFGDSLSHEVFGIDGLVSWSHQPLEAGLVAASLGAVLMLRGGGCAGRRVLLPLAAASFICFAMWLGFNLALLPGHVLLCMPVYEIFASGCAVM